MEDEKYISRNNFVTTLPEQHLLFAICSFTEVISFLKWISITTGMRSFRHFCIQLSIKIIEKPSISKKVIQYVWSYTCLGYCIASYCAEFLVKSSVFNTSIVYLMSEEIHNAKKRGPMLWYFFAILYSCVLFGYLNNPIYFIPGLIT